MNKEQIMQTIVEEIKHYDWDDCLEAFHTIFCPSEVEYIEKIWMTDEVIQTIEDFLFFNHNNGSITFHTWL